MISELAATREKQKPMTIRIKWKGHAWWAYFGGWPESYMFAEKLEDMCNAIAKTFPAGTMMEDWE